MDAPRDLSNDEITRRKKLVEEGREHEIGFLDTDHVKGFDLDDDFILQAEQTFDENKDNNVTDFWKDKYLKEVGKSWNIFYKEKSDKFWKDRSWLLREFPELSPFFFYKSEEYGGKSPWDIAIHEVKDEDRRLLVEVGCGTGSTIFPVLSRNPFLRAIGFDFSPRAIDTLKDRYRRVCEGLKAGEDVPILKGIFEGGHVWDITKDLKYCQSHESSEISELCSEISELGQTRFADVLCLIFVLSAIQSSERQKAAKRCVDLLSSGGYLLFRDYGRYDELEMKFVSSKIPKKVEDHFYVRGDGTLQYYWSIEEVDELFISLGLEKVKSEYILREFKNRKTDQVLKRVWVQGRYRKP